MTNVPAPYRVPVWRLAAQAEGIDLQLVFCGQPHIDTSLSPDDYGFTKHFLAGPYKIMDSRFTHSDFGVWALLNRLRPDVVITTGYIPTFMYAFAWAVAHGAPHIAMTDGTYRSELSLSWKHKLVRHIVLRLSSGFIGASEGSRELFRQYGVDAGRMHLSYLCTDNDRFNCPPSATAADFLFCGRFVALKRPLLVLDVAQATAIRLGRRVSVDFVGSGELETQMRQYAAEMAEHVECRFLGYASQAELPQRYAHARLFLFPTENDTWGVVANEACAAGLPVIVSPHAGVAGELIVDGYNGYVREMDVELWTAAAVDLLTDEAKYRQFAANSREQVKEYSYANSAKGLVAAIRESDALRRKNP
ncbi:MAG: glycosyltransferase family 4 protein [Methylococcales bacterium]|nr:glycosyltransferase family 4 protein [Methylococcales bacterium]